MRTGHEIGGTGQSTCTEDFEGQVVHEVGLEAAWGGEILGREWLTPCECQPWRFPMAVRPYSSDKSTKIILFLYRLP